MSTEERIGGRSLWRVVTGLRASDTNMSIFVSTSETAGDSGASSVPARSHAVAPLGDVEPHARAYAAEVRYCDWATLRVID